MQFSQRTAALIIKKNDTVPWQKQRLTCNDGHESLQTKLPCIHIPHLYTTVHVQHKFIFEMLKQTERRNVITVSRLVNSKYIRIDR